MVMGLMISFLPEYMPTLILADVKTDDGTVKISNVFQMATAGSLELRSIEVQIKYPRRVRENETLHVSAKITQRYKTNLHKGSTDPPLSGELGSLAWDISLNLHGAAFNIAPTDISFVAGTSLPVSADWTAAPNRTGDHLLLLYGGGIVPAGDGWHKPAFQSQIEVNGSVLGPNSNFPLMLRLEVVTKWGVSQFWADLVAGAIAFIGFVLTLFQIRIMIVHRRK